jgi:hypothetical protein
MCTNSINFTCTCTQQPIKKISIKHQNDLKLLLRCTFKCSTGI